MSGWRIGSLFSGIGGLELGLERAGLGATVVQVEQDPYCLQALAHHWPDAKRYDDVRAVGSQELGGLEVLCGGFPCQDISNANQNAAGLDGERSGLWAEFARIIGEVRPRIVVVENVAALLRRGLDRVLGDLAKMGYDAEWGCISAASVGAPHLRERVFIVAYPDGFGSLDGGLGVFSTENQLAALAYLAGRRAAMADVNGQPGDQRGACDAAEGQGGRYVDRGRIQPVLADSCGVRRPKGEPDIRGRQQDASRRGIILADSLCQGLERRRASGPTTYTPEGPRSRPGGWSVEPLVGRVAHGIPDRVDRLRCLGNAVVPQVAEYLGGLIVTACTKNGPEAD